jgi:hypothetical protein
MRLNLVRHVESGYSRFDENSEPLRTILPNANIRVGWAAKKDSSEFDFPTHFQPNNHHVSLAVQEACRGAAYVFFQFLTGFFSFRQLPRHVRPSHFDSNLFFKLMALP